MKKYSIYILILLVGLVFGKFLFGNASSDKAAHDHENSTTKQQWTCSMHPQIMQAEAGSCPICGMDLIPVETGADGLLPEQFQLSKNAIALANIQTSVIGTGRIHSNAFKLSGKIVANEEANAVQVSYFSGRIERLTINSTGEKVRKGQLLATIYSPELFAAQQELLTAVTLKESQPALYKAVRNKLKLWKLSENQINQIESSKKVRENFPIYATVSGIVSEKLVELGAAIKQGQPLFKIANLNTVWANFDVYENQIAQFKKGQEILITTNAYPTKKFKAKVSFIDPILDTKTRTVKLRAVLNNKQRIFKPGMFVEGKIKGSKITKAQILSIPSSAVLWTGKRSVVYLKINPNEPIFEMREIELGNQVGENYEVLSGLKNGDEVVTNGTFTVDAAAQLQGKKSMMNKAGDKTMTGHEGHINKENEEESNAKHRDPKEIEQIAVDQKFQEQLKLVVDAYIVLKNSLVKGDSKMAKQAASTILKSLEKVDMKLLPNKNAHKHWMGIATNIKTVVLKIDNTSDITNQRDHFIELSSFFTKAVQLFGINKKVYNQFCPMAADNKGAFWLSYNKTIRNPYFGDAMLRCGEVKGTFQ